MFISWYHFLYFDEPKHINSRWPPVDSHRWSYWKFTSKENVPRNWCHTNLPIKCFTQSPFLKSFCILTSLNHITDYTQGDWQELRQPSIQALIWYLDVFINTFINLPILVESYMTPHTMITQLRTVYWKNFHNCYWYTDYTHCSWINNALVTRHEIWSAYENYVWLTVTSSLRMYPILIN